LWKESGDLQWEKIEWFVQRDFSKTSRQDLELFKKLFFRMFPAVSKSEEESEEE